MAESSSSWICYCVLLHYQLLFISFYSLYYKYFRNYRSIQCHKCLNFLKTHIDNIYIYSVTMIRILYLGLIRRVLVCNTCRITTRTSINTIYSLVSRKFVLVHWWMNGESDGSAGAGARAGASMSLTVAVWEAEARVKSEVSCVATDRQLGRCLYILHISICKQWVPLL